MLINKLNDIKIHAVGQPFHYDLSHDQWLSLAKLVDIQY